MRYAFGDCVLDTELHELRRTGVPVKLQRKVYQVLAYLVEQRARLVTKQELLEHIWAGVYVEDYAVARSIAAARRAVGDSRTAQRVIRTLYGQGYRFVAQVVANGPEQSAAEASQVAELPLPVPPIVRATARLSEHKLITVLCCRWALSAALASYVDLDGLHEMQQAVEALVQRAVEPYGGMLQHWASDRSEVIFGAPVAQEDHASRAVLAALELQQRWQELPGVLGSSPQRMLTFQIGLHTGPVVVEMREDNAPHHLTVVGEVPALAAALAQQAAPGTIVVSAAVARLIPEDVRLEAMPPVPGVGEPRSLTGYRVHGRESERARRGRLRKDWSSPFIGRDEELQALHRRLARVQEGQGQVVGIVGEPGIGKTRLLAEFQHSLVGKSVTYLAERCQAYGTATPYLPFGRLVRQLWGLMEADSPAICRAKVCAGLHHLGMDTDASAPAVLDLLGLAEVTDPWVGLSPQARKARIFATLHQLFLESSRAQPLVVEVENLHWADPSTEEYLTALVARLSSVPVLLLVSYRPGYRPPWMASSISAQIALLPLAPYHSRRLVQAALRHQALPAVVLQQMLTKAGGNPLFLEELALSVSEQSEAAQALAVPDTIQAVLAARIDRLPSEAKYLLQTSAVIGSEVPEPLLRALVTLPNEILAESLSHLQTSEFLFETRVFPTLTYTFKHALTQEVAYRSLLRRRRQQIHAQIVQVVSGDFPELAEAQPERLAYHATEAGLHAQAVSYWLRAGQRAVERSAHQEAITHLTKGLDLLQRSPQTPERTQQELMFHIALGASRLITEGHAAPDVQRMYTRAYELCQQVEETPQLAPVLLGLWRFYLVRGELAQARVLSERLLSLAQRLDDPSLLVLAHYMRGATLFWSGTLVQASLHLEEGTARYDPDQHRALAFHSGQDPGVACLAFAARALWILGYPDQALQRAQEALRCAQTLDHPFSEAFALTFLAYIHLRRREWRAAQRHAETVVALATAQGFPFWRALATIQHGWALVAQGQAEAGLNEMRQGVTAWRATGAGLGKPFFLGLLAEVHGCLEQHVQGLSLLTEALAVVDVTGERWCEPDLYRLKGELLLARSAADQTEGETCLQHALALARRQQAKSWELRTALILSRLWLQHGKREEARQLLAEVFSWFTEGFDTADLQEAKALLEALA